MCNLSEMVQRCSTSRSCTKSSSGRLLGRKGWRYEGTADAAQEEPPPLPSLPLLSSSRLERIGSSCESVASLQSFASEGTSPSSRREVIIFAFAAVACS